MPQNLILASKLIKPPAPVGGLVEKTGSLQLAEPPHDKFLRVEVHRLTWAILSEPGAPQDSNGRWTEAEEVKPTAARPITFEAIEEGTMTFVQHALTKGTGDCSPG